MPLRLAPFFLALTFIFSAFAQAGIAYPGSSRPGAAEAKEQDGVFTLQNQAVSMTWTFHQGELRPAELSDLLSGQSFAQDNRELFRFAVTDKAEAPSEEEQSWLGLSWDSEQYLVQTSTNGKGWHTIARIPARDFKGEPSLVHLGKMDKDGAASDYPDAGELGSPRFDDFAILGDQTTLFVDQFNEGSLDDSWKQQLSEHADTSLSLEGGWLQLQAAANCAAYLERELADGARQVICRVDRADDQGQSWGPGLALLWPDGQSLLVNIRKEGSCSVIAQGKEEVITSPFQDVPSYNAIASRMEVYEEPMLIDLPAEPNSPRLGSHQPGKAIVATLRDETTGLAVRWRAVLRDDSSYIREELTIATLHEPLTLTGVQMLDRSVPNAASVGSVPGSPVVAGQLFFGAEIPVFSSDSDADGFTIGFPCTYRLEGNELVQFSSLAGVVPEGQLRRGFQYYLERERARPAQQYLHYNGWYETGPNVSESNLLEVIDAYRHELVEQRGVKLDGFVIDDGWDDAQNTFWGWKESTLPHGLDKIRRAAQEAGAGLGIWISPLGGYGGSELRIGNARKEGIITGDTLDLSQQSYYRWFRDKCLELMENDGVKYFKWDKAGNGVNPHFMSLLKIADELHAVDPELFINVTVGTWASPFWLNHVDCTWHGGADVFWIGKGDKREQWLSYRDSSAYNYAQRGPLYPLNSLMLHGLVLGHEYQGATVAEAGNDLRHECRTFFATGTCLQEVYLSPDLMDEAAWDDLAETATWSREHAEVLVDSHMIGGDPAKLEPYGWASWMPGAAVVALRNPDDQVRAITLDAQTIFELPENAPSQYQLNSAYPDQRLQTLELEANKDLTIELQPFEVLVFDTDQ